MATITVSASTTLALLTYAADDDIVITGAATLTVNSDPTALPAIRSIRSSSPRAILKVRNSATAFTAGNLWKLSFTNPGSAIGSGNATLGFTSGATMDFEGEWLTCYTATGVASETVLDASNVLGVDIDFPYFIEAETAVGSGVYKAVPVGVIGTPGNGFLTTVAQSAFGTGDVGRVLFYDHATRLLRTGDGTNGSLFAAGIKFRIPNIYVHMPAFTLTVAAGGWTTGTGPQNVSSSTNAPILSAGNVNYTAGAECFNISATPSGTTVTVNNRASDGSTATAHAAGTVVYALPHASATMAGRVWIESNGIFKSKKAWFGRWMNPRPVNGRIWDMEDTGLCAEVSGNGFVFANTLALSRVIRGVVCGNPGRGVQGGLRANPLVGNLEVDGVLCVVQYSSSATASYTQFNNPFQIAFGVSTLQKFDNVRLWAIGITTAMSLPAGSIQLLSTPANKKITNLEVVGIGLSVAMSGASINGFRYSQTNGALSTSNANAISMGNGQPADNVVVYNYGLISGGVAPYNAFFSINTAASGCVFHNKIGGSLTTIDCQNRTATPVQPLAGNRHIFSHVKFSNQRGSFQVISGVASDNTVRNVRTTKLNDSIQAQSRFGLDYPAAPLGSGQISTFDDSASFYAAPNAGDTADGGVYFGPTSQEKDRDLYELTAGAYTNNIGDFFIETSGDAVLFKSPERITGVSGITGGAVVYTAHSNITTGVTAEFRLCKWGDDITAVSWVSFTGGNVQTAFNALSGYTPYIGLNFQLRFTATTTVAGRYIRQCYVPCQMDTAYNPPVGSVDITIVGAAVGAIAALYDGSGARVDVETIDAGGGAVLAGPYDFDDVEVTGALKIREIESRSIDTVISWVGETTVPAPMAALTGYVAGPYAGASFNKGTKTVTITSAMTTQQLWSAWREYIVQLANFDTDDSWTYPDLNTSDWAVAFSGAGALTGNYTDVNGSQAVISAPNLPSGTRVQFYNVTASSQISNELLASPGATASLYFASNPTIRLRASKLGELPIESFGVLTPSGLTFIDEFVADDVYAAKGIDGSTVTEFTADEPNVQIDSNDPDGVSSVWRCYAWWRYYETLSLGIAGVLFGKATAVDTENLAVNAAIQLDNIHSTPLKMNDGYMYRTDGVTIIASGSGSIQMDPKKAYGVESEDVEAGYSMARTLRIIAAAVAGKTTGGPGGFVARNLSDTADQITGTATADGNRTPTGYGS